MDSNKQRCQDVVLGGLLHDVGKLVQRAERKRRNHMETGATWLEERQRWSPWAFAARYHHEDYRASVKLSDLKEPRQRYLAALISKADNLSASEREEVTGTWDQNVSLQNLFDGLGKEGIGSRRPTFFPPAPLSDKIPLLPSDTPPQDLQVRYQNLERGLRELLDGATPEQVAPEWLLRVLEVYTSLVPSETSVGEDRYPDISLFDHLRTTAMIALCLMEALEAADPTLPERPEPEKRIAELLKKTVPEPFLLVEGDMGGVQRYLYDLSGKGALRGLRARSFSLELLQEEILDRILGDLGYSRVQVLFVGGGHFLLLLPRTSFVLECLEAQRRGLQRDLWNRDPRLSFSLAWCPLGVEELGRENFREPLRRLREELTRRKTTPQREILPHILGIEKRTEGRVCKVCGAWVDRLYEMKEEPEVACEVCRDLYDLGGNLSSARYLWRGKRTQWGYGDRVDQVPAEVDRVWVLREARETLGQEDRRFLPLPWGEYAYDDRIDVLLREGCPGARHLGGLRMDVDNLGSLFGTLNPASLSRFATLSRLFTYFFRTLVPLMASRPDRLAREFPRRVPGTWADERRRLVLVYAGGDDLFALGAWNEVAEYALDLLDLFRRFVGGNPEVSLSGGVSVVGDKTPVAALARSAGVAEEAAKSHRMTRGDRILCKNALALFHQGGGGVVGESADSVFHVREELPQVLQWLKSLTVGGTAVPGAPLRTAYDRAFLRRLMEYDRVSRRRDRGPLWKALAAYGVSREPGGREREHLNRLLREGTGSLSSVRTAAQWVDWLLRPAQSATE